MQILKSTKVIFVLIGFLFTCNFLQAENDQKMKAVHELFEAMDTKNNFDKTIVKMIDVQIQQQPQIKIFRKTMLKFMNKYMGWESLKEDMAKIYTSKFTLQELIELK